AELSGAALDDSSGNVVREISGLSARALRIRKDVEISEGERFDEGECGGVIVFGLTRKTRDNIGADGGVREALVDELDAARIMLGAVPAVHGGKNAVRAGLQGHVEVLREAIGGSKKLDEILRDVHRLDGADAQALDASLVQDSPEQVFEFEARR